MSILPIAIENLRGEDDDLSCNLATSFFLGAEASKDIVYPNLQKCLSVFIASGDREQLKQYLPDTMKFKLLQGYNIIGDGTPGLFIFSGNRFSYTFYKANQIGLGFIYTFFVCKNSKS